MKTLPILLFTLILSSCTNSSQSIDDITIDPTEDPTETPMSVDLYFPPNNSSVWETISPESLEWNTENLAELDNFLVNTGSKAFIILKNGKIAKESYYNGSVETDNFPWNSAGKTLTAFTTMQAQNDGILNIEDSTSDYLGNGWTNMTLEQEQAITIKNQLTMTSGGDFTNENTGCTDPECLDYLFDPNTNWYYYNAYYTLIQPVLDNAIPQGFDTYFNSELKSKIGMQGAWVQLGYVRVYFSQARSMARFGLLNLNKGTWDSEELLSENNIIEMTSTSQQLNPAYGYLWWLNGKNTYKLPSSNETFNGQLVPNAPADLVAGLGANDQKLYVVPSKNLVIIRLGDSGETDVLGPSGYDNLLWEKINAVIN